MRRAVLVATMACVLLGTLGTTAGVRAHADQAPPDPDTIDPPTQYAIGDAIVLHIQVPVPPTVVDAIDTTNAPSVDYIWVDYIRPNTATGVTVPTIMDASPYYNVLGRGYREQFKLPFDPTLNNEAGTDVSPNKALCEQASCPSVAFPEWYADYFVPRGYAVAEMDLRGTRNSTGCEIYGDKQEALDAVAVIDWIASQSWSNGKVGMIGGSYDGTLANGAAALYPIYGKHDPDTLAAVVPIRAIDRWYDYQFFNGVEANGQELDPEEFSQAFPADDIPNSGPNAPGGDPNYSADVAQRDSCPVIGGIPTDSGYASPYQDTKDAGTTNFWNARDFLQYAPTWRAATFLIHGLYDFNVKTMNSGQLWEALPSSVPKKLWYFNGDHDDPDTPTVAAGQTAGYLMPFPFQQQYETEVHRWFLQYLKGVDAGESLTSPFSVQRDDGHFDSYGSYPADPTYADDTVLHFTPTGTATTTPAPSGSVQWDDTASGTSGAPASQSFASAAVPVDTRLSGQFSFSLNVAAAGPDTTIAVEVDDVPPNAATGLASEDVSTRNQAFAFNYAYIRPYYRASINPRGVSYPTGGSFLTPNTQYEVSFPSTYMDYVLHAGHKLRFTFSDASPYSLPTYQGNTVTMSTGGSDGVSLVRVPEVPLSPPADVAEFGGAPGLVAVGGPLTLLAGAELVRRRSRRVGGRAR